MGITTKRGDDGYTRLFSGEKIPKDAIQPDTYGDIDELVSVLGLARAHCHDQEIQERLIWVQKQLFVLASELATMPPKRETLQRLGADALSVLEEWCVDIERIIVMPRDFVLPGETVVGATLDMARSVARRCERRVVTMYREGLIDNSFLLPWINRVSDYLWLQARLVEQRKCKS